MNVPSLSIEQNLLGKLPQQPIKRDWRFWLVPRPYVLLTTWGYLLCAIGWFWGPVQLFQVLSWQRFFTLIGGWGPVVPLTIGGLIVLLVLDRVDAWVGGDNTPSRRSAIALLLVRIAVVLVTVEGLKRHAGLSLWPLYLYLTVPLSAAYAFSTRTAVLLAVAAVGAALLRLAPIWRPLTRSWWWWTYTSIDGSLVGLLLAGLAAVLLTYVLSDEVASRRRLARLVAELRRSRRAVEAAVRGTLALRSERQRLAREIHEQLGQTLSQLAVQLEKALQYRSRDAVTADTAVHDAKQLGSQALADVRRSVGVLRVRPAGGGDPAVFDPLQPPDSAPRARLPFDRLVLLPLLWCAAYYLIILLPAGESDLMPSMRYIVVGLVLALLALDWVDHFLVHGVRRRLGAPALIVLRGALIVAIALTTDPWFALWLLPLIPNAAFRYYAPRRALRLSVLIYAGLLGLLCLILGLEEPVAYGNLAVDVLFWVGPFLIMITMSYAVVMERTQRLEAERLLNDLRGSYREFTHASAQAIEAVAQRNHLARDIHDGLGHYFTVINVQLEKAIAFRPVDAPTADDALLVARRLVADALLDVRSTFSALSRSDELPSLAEALHRLVDNTGELQIELRIEGDTTGLAEPAQLALYRVAQEALTNIQRHASATRATVELIVEPGEARLRICDDGHGFDPLRLAAEDSTQRFGLNGMRERLEVVGGTLSVNSRAGAGTCIEAGVPLSQPIGWNDPVTEQAS